MAGYTPVSACGNAGMPASKRGEEATTWRKLSPSRTPRASGATLAGPAHYAQGCGSDVLHRYWGLPTLSGLNKFHKLTKGEVYQQLLYHSLTLPIYSSFKKMEEERYSEGNNSRSAESPGE